MEEERYEYFDLWKCIYVLDTKTNTIVYYKDGEWREEFDMTPHALRMNDMGLRVGEKWAFEKTKGSTPFAKFEELEEQDRLKDIYCP